MQMQLLACSGHIKVAVLLRTANNLQNTFILIYMHAAGAMQQVPCSASMHAINQSVIDL